MRELMRSVLTQAVILRVDWYSCLNDLLYCIKHFDSEYLDVLPERKVIKYFVDEQKRVQKTLARGERKFYEYLNLQNGWGLTDQQILWLEKKIGLPYDLIKLLLNQNKLPVYEQQYLDARENWINSGRPSLHI